MSIVQQDTPDQVMFSGPEMIIYDFKKTLFAPCGPSWYVFLYEKNTLYIIPIQGEKLLLHLDVHQRWASIKT